MNRKLLVIIGQEHGYAKGGQRDLPLFGLKKSASTFSIHKGIGLSQSFMNDGSYKAGVPFGVNGKRWKDR